MYKNIIFVFLLLLINNVNCFNNKFFYLKNKKNNIIKKNLNNIHDYSCFLSNNKTKYYNIETIVDYNIMKNNINNNTEIIILNFENNKIIKNIKDILL